MSSELQRNREMKPLEDIKQIVQFWNQKHCKPPLNHIEFEKQWKQAIKFVSKSITDNNNNELENIKIQKQNKERT